MSFSYYKVLWLLVHALVSLFEAVFHFGLEFRENFCNFIKKISQSRCNHTTTSDRLLIENQLHELKKLPKHLGVILSASSEKDVDVQKLTRLVTWALSSGINYISFYDYKGFVKHRLSSSFHDAIEQHTIKTDGDNIVWGPDHQSPSIDGTRFPHRNGFKRHIVVNLFSFEDGQEQFTKLMRLKGNDRLESKRITIDFIDEQLGRLSGNLPDPDLAVFFGNACCTQGFLPWQIRLTEFIPISHKLKSLTLEKYIQVLYKYAKCEQRFGK